MEQCFSVCVVCVLLCCLHRLCCIVCVVFIVLFVLFMLFALCCLCCLYCLCCLCCYYGLCCLCSLYSLCCLCCLFVNPHLRQFCMYWAELVLSFSIFCFTTYLWETLNKCNFSAQMPILFKHQSQSPVVLLETWSKYSMNAMWPRYLYCRRHNPSIY